MRLYRGFVFEVVEVEFRSVGGEGESTDRVGLIAAKLESVVSNSSNTDLFALGTREV